MNKTNFFNTMLLALILMCISSCTKKTTEPVVALSNVAVPMITLAAGTYYETQSTTITCSTEGATIRYSTNGSEPTDTSTIYSESITISVSMTIKAKAFKTGMNPSSMVSQTYTIAPVQYDEMVLVQGGTFNNGTSNVTLSSFYMGKYEITQLIYQQIMEENPSNFTGQIYRPVENSSWFNAIDYCNKKSIKENLTPCYTYYNYGTNPTNWPSGWDSADSNHINVSCNWSANGYRLPTEAEWQFVALGGIQTHGYLYSGSNSISVVGWWDENGSGGTHRVGLKQANELGLFDMTGNVYEWCWDMNGAYASGDQTNPHGNNSGAERAWRGGGWICPAEYCTVTLRDFTSPTSAFSFLGFRICRNAQEYK